MGHCRWEYVMFPHMFGIHSTHPQWIGGKTYGPTGKTSCAMEKTWNTMERTMISYRFSHQIPISPDGFPAKVAMRRWLSAVAAVEPQVWGQLLQIGDLEAVQEAARFCQDGIL